MSRPVVILATALGLVWLAACAGGPEPFEGSPTRGQMITHFDLALEAREHAVMGDVEAFRRAVEDLDELPPARDLPPELMLQFGPMRWEAREAARARTTEAAAMGAARVAQTCGDCHVANEAGLGERFTTGGPPPAGSVGRHMAGLSWASRLLWDGLVGPSDLTWYTGAEALIELGALPEGLDAVVPAPRIEEAEARLRQLGHRATQTASPEGRMVVLADVWATCADCHAGSR